MQVASQSYNLAYERAVSLRALPRVIFEWNHNRTCPMVVASNGGDTTEDALFPITSIMNGVRGRSGIIKGRVGEARTYKSTSNTAAQYRTVGPRSNYRYWTSPNQSGSTNTISGVSPQVVYSPAVRTNKIIVAVERSWAYPTDWTVSITENGTDWTQVASNTSHSISDKGEIVISRAEQNIRGVRFNVTRMSKPNAHVNVIEISARLEVDFSDIVINASTDRSTDEPSPIFPVGKVTSNSGTVVLDNTDRLFDTDNTASPYYGLLDTNVKMTIAFGTDVSTYGGGFEYVQQAVLYSDKWNPNIADSTVEVPGTDATKFLQQMQMEPVLFQNRTPGQIVAEVLSSVGFNNYSIDIANDEGQSKIPFVWFTAEDNVWEALQELCSSVQGTLYTDEFGTIRFVSREKTFENANDVPDLEISGENNGSDLANLESLDTEFTVEANKVVVAYKPLIANSKKTPVDKTVELELPGTRVVRRYNRREYDTVPIESVLWKPDNTVTLRASELARNITAHGDTIYVKQGDAKSWPWTGTINVEGEIMSYEGKEYLWWKNGVQQTSVVKNQEEQNNIDDMQSDLITRHKNTYNGRLMNVKRGQHGTKAAPHVVDLASWKCYRKNVNNTIDQTPVRMTQQGSEMVLWGYAGDEQGTYTYAHRGYFSDAYRGYGTRLRFANTSYSVGTAGLFWQLQPDNKQGYYVEINLSSHAINTMKGAINEIRVYRMMADGHRRALPHPTNNARGWEYPVVKNNWIDIDVTSTNTGTFSVYVNGKLITSFRDPDGTLPPGTWGPFVRDHSVAAFEYFYVMNTANDLPPDIDASSFQHKVKGGYVSGFADREVSRKDVKTVNWYMDEFGPWVHEMRKFKVEFDKVPALDAQVYLSNTWDAYLIDSNRTPFDATFWIANSGRDNAVLSGDDPTVHIGGSEVKQQIFLYGQVVVEEEESTVNKEQQGIYTTDTTTNNNITYSNDYAIRKRGVVELTVDSKWIQSRSQAEALGEWITKHWSEPVDNVSVTGYFPPTVQLGDLATVNYPDRNMSPESHRYHVVGISSSFNSGIQMSLRLRRVR